LPSVCTVSSCSHMSFFALSTQDRLMLSNLPRHFLSHTPLLIPEAVFTGECPTSSQDILHTDHHQLVPRIEHLRLLFPSRDMSNLLAQLNRPQASKRTLMPHKEIALSPFLVLPLHPCRPHDCCCAIGNAIWVLSIIALLLTFASSIVTMVSEMFGPSTRPNVIHMPVMELVVM